MSKTNAMILAAGRGTRLKDLTMSMPKPLVPVAGVRPLERTLQLLEEAGYNHTVINAWYFAEQIVDVASEYGNMDIEVICEDELLDTGGGIKNALPSLGEEPFLVVNGDLVWSEELHPVLKELPTLFDESKMDALLLLIPTDKALGYSGKGDFFLDTGNLLKWRNGSASAPYVYACIQILHPRLFNGLPDVPFSMMDAYHKAAKAGRLYGHVYQGEWADMGTPKGMQAANDLLVRIGRSVAA